MLAPAVADAHVYYVSAGAGNDAGPGSAGQPFATIGHAADAARPGDAVMVGPGVYHEQVTLGSRDARVTFRGYGSSRPVVAGDGVRRFGFQVLTRQATVDNFEISGQTDYGVYLVGGSNAVTGNFIHNVGAYGNQYGKGVWDGFGDHDRISGNVIRSIGPGGEAMGVMLADAHDVDVADNTIYLVRKEGVRDWQGMDNTIERNRVFLTWSAIDPIEATGSEVVDNYVYDNTWGFSPKHTSDAPTLQYWHLTAPRWTRFWHNTVYRSSEASIALGENAPVGDYLDVRDNVFDDAGAAHLFDDPGGRAADMIVDGNAYVGPGYLYHSGWNFQTGGYTSLSQLTAQLGWEQHGVVLPQAAVSDGTVSAAGAVELPDGAQLGAGGFPAPIGYWTPYQMRAVGSSSQGSWWTAHHLQDSADGRQQTYWLTNTGQDEWVTYDLGRRLPINLIVLDVFGHYDNRDVRGYRFATSDDGVHFTTVLAGTNPDSEGSSYKYELPRTVTARYLRFTLVDTFCSSYTPRSGCGSYFVLSDLRAGLLSGGRPLHPAGRPRCARVRRRARRVACRVRARHRKKHRRRRP
jgi:hypothetical protein